MLGFGLPGGSDGKESACNVGDPGSGRSPREGHDNPLQYSCLENLMDRGAGGATVRGFAQSLTRLKRLGTHALVCFQLLTYIDVAVMVKVRVLRKIKFPHFLSF